MTGIPFQNDAASPSFIPNSRTEVIDNATPGYVIPPASSFLSNVYAVSAYNSYNFSTTPWVSPQASTLAALTAQILVTFYADAAGTMPIYSERWYGWAANSAGAAAAIKGRGPMAGPYMTVQIFNNSATQNMTLVTTSLFGNSVVVPESDWRQNSIGGINAGDGLIEGLPAAYGDDCILASAENLSIGASMVEWQPLPLAKGPIYYRMRFSGALTNGVAICIGAGLQYGELAAGASAVGIVAYTGSAATTEYTGVVSAGRSPLYMILQTTAAVTVSFTFMSVSPGS